MAPSHLYNNVSSWIAKPIKSFGSARTAYIMHFGRIDLYYIIIMWVRRVLKSQSLYDIRACVRAWSTSDSRVLYICIWAKAVVSQCIYYNESLERNVYAIYAAVRIMRSGFRKFSKNFFGIKVSQSLFVYTARHYNNMYIPKQRQFVYYIILYRSDSRRRLSI